MNQNRPDPDMLLAEVTAQRQRASRGKLKIFFGACPGVGKTYSMLQSLRRLREEGVRVLVGVAETHGSTETARLLEDLPHQPLREVEYRGRTLREFDLDAALAAHPALIAVDELAHGNVAGSRHLKRWQDVEELLAAGIDVCTTLNVQHLESLNDVVGRITGIRVHETVPDPVFDNADDVVVVDLPADELLKRLAEGKVYLPDAAARAKETCERVLAAIGYADVRTDPRIYEATPGTLIRVLDEHTDANPLLLVGHNPGLENLVALLTEGASDSGRGIPPAGVVWLGLPADAPTDPGTAAVHHFWWP